MVVARREADAGERWFSAPAPAFGQLTYSDPALEPLWQVLDGCGAFLFLHPGECCDGRLSDYYLGNLLGNPYETTVAAAHLVFGGVIERYPGLTFGLAHGGGATALLAGRWQRGFDTSRPGISLSGSPPVDLIRRIYVDSIVHGAAGLELVASVFGDDHILFGSDWPFPMGITAPGEMLADIDPDLRKQIFVNNPRQLIESLTV